MVEEKKVFKSHSVILENRKTMTVSAVQYVDSFDESSVVMITSAGELVVNGTDLHINKLNIESGDVQIEGDLDSIEYAKTAAQKTGFFAKLLK